MTRTRLLALAAGLGLMMSLPAIADDGYTIKSTNLRAGPDRDYPVVSRIPEGAPVQVEGCVNDWTWCDVSFGPDRGWAYAGNIAYPYEGRRVSILESGAYMGLAVVPFAVGPYWDTYYRGRPWYGRRSYWIGRPVPHNTVVIHPGRAVVMRPDHRGPDHRGVEHRGVEHRTTERRAPEHRESEHRQVQQQHSANRAPVAHQNSRPAEHKRPEKDHH